MLWIRMASKYTNATKHTTPNSLCSDRFFHSKHSILPPSDLSIFPGLGIRSDLICLQCVYTLFSFLFLSLSARVLQCLGDKCSLLPASRMNPINDTYAFIKRASSHQYHITYLQNGLVRWLGVSVSVTLDSNPIQINTCEFIRIHDMHTCNLQIVPH